MSKILKNIFLFLVIVIVGSFTTGCVSVKVNEELTINEDKTANHTIQILASDNVSMFQDRIEQGITNSLNNLGMLNTSQVSEINYFGIKGSKDFSFDELSDQGNQYFSIQDDSVDYFVYKHMNYTVNIDVDSIFKDYDPSFVTLEDYKFTLNLPVKITDSNAQNVFNDNHSATWHLYRGSNNTMHVEFDVINPTNIIISVVVFFLIVSFIIILLVVLLNKKPKKTNTTTLAKQNEKHTSSKTYFCGECGTKINQDMEYCPNCGARIEIETTENDIQYCGNCGAQIKSSMEYCPNCGEKQS